MEHGVSLTLCTSPFKKNLLHISGDTGIALSASTLTTNDSSGFKYNSNKDPSAFPATLAYLHRYFVSSVSSEDFLNVSLFSRTSTREPFDNLATPLITDAVWCKY